MREEKFNNTYLATLAPKNKKQLQDYRKTNVFGDTFTNSRLWNNDACHILKLIRGHLGRHNWYSVSFKSAL